MKALNTFIFSIIQRGRYHCLYITSVKKKSASSGPLCPLCLQGVENPCPKVPPPLLLWPPCLPGPIAPTWSPRTNPTWAPCHPCPSLKLPSSPLPLNRGQPLSAYNSLILPGRGRAHDPGHSIQGPHHLVPAMSLTTSRRPLGPHNAGCSRTTALKYQIRKKKPPPI